MGKKFISFVSYPEGELFVALVEDIQIVRWSEQHHCGIVTFLGKHDDVMISKSEWIKLTDRLLDIEEKHNV